MISVKYTKVNENAAEPRRATAGAAGFDLCAADAVTLRPGDRVPVPSGIAVAIPENHVGFVIGRSGLGLKHGITMANGVGVIDSDYRGEIHVLLTNRSDTVYTVQSGDRIAQLCIVPVIAAEFELTETLPETGRGANGFGSTGR